MRFTGSAAVVFCMARAAWAQGDEVPELRSPARLDLEGDPERALRQDKKADAPKSDMELRASFTDGFHLMTADGSFDLHVGGRVLEEYRSIFDRPIGPAGAPLAPGTARAPADSLTTREIFLSLDGTIYHDWGFKINGDFAAGATLLEEGFMEWKHFKEFRLQFCQFKVPQSSEVIGSPRFLEEIQRTAMARFNPGIEMGVMATGSVADGRVNYWMGVSNGRSHLNNNGRSVVDDNGSKEFEAKLAIMPWAPDPESFLRKFRVGGYYTRDLQGMGSRFTAAPGGPVTLGNVNTNELGVTWVTLPAGAFGERTRWGTEILYAWGPASIRGEYQGRRDRYENAAGTIDERLPVQGYTLTATWLLTGEDKGPIARVNPSRPFDLEGGWGALELVVRYAVCTLDNAQLSAIGVSTANGANTNRVSAFTAGLNWWTTKNTRLSVDYVAELYNDPLQFEADKNRASLGGILARFQVDF